LVNPHISALTWLLTLAGLLAIIALDLTVVARRRQPVGTASAVRWIGFYIALAVAFGGILFAAFGRVVSTEFAASYITEYSLSADNLFVFLLIIGRFAVPADVVDQVLYLGILVSLVLRAAFIFAGAAAVTSFSWVFYPFAAFLLYTAIRLLVAGDDDPDQPAEGVAVRALRRVLPTTSQYNGRRLSVTEDGHRRFTPIVLVIGSIGVANVVFALDSIPAVFGPTRSAYIVLAANAFAMMGLRQLYFLIGDLLRRLAYLNIGLALILGFIGVKLALEALDGSDVHRLGPVRLPVIGVEVSLIVIIVTLMVTTLASVARNRFGPPLRSPSPSDNSTP
jgi:TerC family integral membrane protein